MCIKCIPIFDEGFICSELEEQLHEQEKEYKALAHAMQIVELRRKSLEEDKLKEEEDLDDKRKQLQIKTHELDMLTKDFELSKEREAILMGDR